MWKKLWPFLAWLALFYTVWLTVVTGFGFWDEVFSHWPISLAMMAGSYFAGSTPMGGGTVGFPVLVLLFDQPASLGRSFGLAVQSIGMVSASIYILAARRPIDLRLLRPALVGTLIGTPLGAAFIAPYAPDLAVKLIFAVVWAGFGVIHFLKLGAILKPDGTRDPHGTFDAPIGLAIGLTGGIVASLTGVGIDMMIYAVLVLFYREDLKIAIPTSVILMAATSVIGIFSNILLSKINPDLYYLSPEVAWNFLAAAPVVALGAPLGAIVVNRLPRAPTLLIVCTLCIVQYVWTVLKEQVSLPVFALSLGGIVLMNVMFLWLFKMGERNTHRVRRVSGDAVQAGLAANDPDGKGDPASVG
ncbi:sulfite exporter TauE/SafE family protein [Aquisalinus flavus]|nr:sulfite exporter TauE/SafE family protein [Aquisalinus flavus]UNE49170.1 sulfite exporter TauE/SafE family protein [Aquisalinus flavus]